MLISFFLPIPFHLRTVSLLNCMPGGRNYLNIYFCMLLWKPLLTRVGYKKSFKTCKL